MGESIAGIKRTHRCGELTNNDIGKKVTVMGWAHKRRDLGSLIFVDLRDRAGLVQVVFDSSKQPEAFQKAEAVRSEFVLAIVGEVVKRDPETYNPKISTGEIEIRAEEIRILSKSETPPIYIEEDTDTNELVRLKYRYLDIRRPDMQRTLMLRAKAANIARDYFAEQGFIEIETPMLINSTPEGARDYLVPSRIHPGSFYALPQSPQLFKQMLMVAGMDRYIQIVKCFRDEDLRAERQPEFTQIDLEMAFIDVDDVIEVNEGFIKKVFKETIGVDVETPLPRLSYQEAMDRYGSDKPDTRFELELVNVTDIANGCGFKVFADAAANGGSVRGINAKGCGEKFSRREIDALTEFVKIYKAKGLAWIQIEEGELKSPITKFLSEDETKSLLERMEAEKGDLLLFVADKNQIVYDALGQLRLELGRKLELMDKNVYKFLWVTEFPLLEYDQEEKRYVAKHHPFTSPMDEDVVLLDTEPEKVRAKAYDIVLNGVEMGGGSIRIHNNELQAKMFELLGFSNEEAKNKFGYLLEAFKYGTPPHGGLAYGFDRMIMLLTGKDNIRDVIAFPKVQNASCPLSQAPTEVEPKQLKELHIKLDK